MLHFKTHLKDLRLLLLLSLELRADPLVTDGPVEVEGIKVEVEGSSSRLQANHSSL
jgi:hypothetical protein